MFESAAVAQRTNAKVREIAESATGFAAVLAHACCVVLVLVVFAFLLVLTERTLRDEVCSISHPFHLLMFAIKIRFASRRVLIFFLVPRTPSRGLSNKLKLKQLSHTYSLLNLFIVHSRAYPTLCMKDYSTITVSFGLDHLESCMYAFQLGFR
jgi:hypothetical protein